MICFDVGFGWLEDGWIGVELNICVLRILGRFVIYLDFCGVIGFVYYGIGLGGGEYRDRGGCDVCSFGKMWCVEDFVNIWVEYRLCGELDFFF